MASSLKKKYETIQVVAGSDLTVRQRDILRSVITMYIRDKYPVSSKTLKEKGGFRCSTATLRNELSVLEKKGYLGHEHTSGGRVPHDTGYRYYVDEIVRVQKAAVKSIDRLSAEYDKKYDEINRLMLETSGMLSSLSDYAGFALAPKINGMNLKRMELIKLDSKNAAMLLITDSNAIKHRLIKLDREFGAEELKMISHFLTEKLKGRKVSEIRESVRTVFSLEQVKYEGLMKCFDACLDNFSRDEDVFLDGVSKVLRYISGNPIGLEEVFENKDRISRIVENRSISEGLRVFIGDEIEEKKFRDFSIVRSTYRTADKNMGLIGIIGPKNMEYGRMTDIVLSVSEALSKVLIKMLGEEEDGE